MAQKLKLKHSTNNSLKFIFQFPIKMSPLSHAENQILHCGRIYATINKMIHTRGTLAMTPWGTAATIQTMLMPCTTGTDIWSHTMAIEATATEKREIIKIGNCNFNF